MLLPLKYTLLPYEPVCFECVTHRLLLFHLVVIIIIPQLWFFSIVWLGIVCFRVNMQKEEEKKGGGKKQSRRRIRCFHPLINGFLKQSTSEEPADQ